MTANASLKSIEVEEQVDGVAADGLASEPAAAEREGCDLIAMATHGHRLVEDLIRGSTATGLRHMTAIPVLMVRVASAKGP